jgi:hypothetical protein
MRGWEPGQIAARLGLPVLRLKKLILAQAWFTEREEQKKKARDAADAEVLTDRKLALSEAVRRQQGAASTLYELAEELKRGGCHRAQDANYLANVLSKAVEIERKVWRMDDADARPKDSSLMDAVLDEMIADGSIKGPVANVSAGASDGGSGATGSAEGAAPQGTPGP